MKNLVNTYLYLCMKLSREHISVDLHTRRKIYCELLQLII